VAGIEIGHYCSAFTAAPPARVLEMSDAPQLDNPRTQGILRHVINDAIFNALYFAIGTAAIILIGSFFWHVGFALAIVEALFATIQCLRVIFIVAADIVIFVLLRAGTKLEFNESQDYWASLVRVGELGIWTGCLFILFRFFFP
jgi:hypothetical protein